MLDQHFICFENVQTVCYEMQDLRHQNIVPQMYMVKVKYRLIDQTSIQEY